MIHYWRERKWIFGAILFTLSFPFLHWVADLLHIAPDKRIYLQGGRLVAQGHKPYRDLFAVTGPLSFWMEAVLAFSSRMRLAARRLPPFFDAAFLAFAVYWLTSPSPKTFRRVVMQENEASR
jgi:hypothetical protein